MEEHIHPREATMVRSRTVSRHQFASQAQLAPTDNLTLTKGMNFMTVHVVSVWVRPGPSHFMIVIIFLHGYDQGRRIEDKIGETADAGTRGTMIDASVSEITHGT